LFGIIVKVATNCAPHTPQTDEEDSESERESEMSSSECEMSEEETFRSINRIIEYEIEYVGQKGKFCQSEQIFVSPNNFCYFY
jgi:hypothetical protein